MSPIELMQAVQHRTLQRGGGLATIRDLSSRQEEALKGVEFASPTDEAIVRAVVGAGLFPDDEMTLEETSNPQGWCEAIVLLHTHGWTEADRRSVEAFLLEQKA